MFSNYLHPSDEGGEIDHREVERSGQQFTDDALLLLEEETGQGSRVEDDLDCEGYLKESLIQEEEIAHEDSEKEIRR